MNCTFFANTLNDELDQQTIFNQQNSEGLSRALQAPQTDPTSINMTLRDYFAAKAMQLELSIMLNAADISQLDFRTPIYYGGVRWRLLEIRDYEIGQQKPCRVTLRRILNLTEFAPKQIYYFPYDGPVPATDSDYPNEVPPIPTIKELPVVAGPPGETGATGATGAVGPTGAGFTPGDAAGDIKYWDGTAWVNLGIGTEGQVLESLPPPQHLQTADTTFTE